IAPPSSSTSTSTVGFPRESRISLAKTSLMMVMEAPEVGGGWLSGPSASLSTHRRLSDFAEVTPKFAVARGQRTATAVSRLRHALAHVGGGQVRGGHDLNKTISTSYQSDSRGRPSWARNLQAVAAARHTPRLAAGHVNGASSTRVAGDAKAAEDLSPNA